MDSIYQFGDFSRHLVVMYFIEQDQIYKAKYKFISLFFIIFKPHSQLNSIIYFILFFGGSNIVKTM